MGLREGRWGLSGTGFRWGHRVSELGIWSFWGAMLREPGSGKWGFGVLGSKLWGAEAWVLLAGWGASQGAGTHGLRLQFEGQRQRAPFPVRLPAAPPPAEAPRAPALRSRRGELPASRARERQPPIRAAVTGPCPPMESPKRGKGGAQGGAFLSVTSRKSPPPSGDWLPWVLRLSVKKPSARAWLGGVQGLVSCGGTDPRSPEPAAPPGLGRCGFLPPARVAAPPVVLRSRCKEGARRRAGWPAIGSQKVQWERLALAQFWPQKHSVTSL